MQTEALSSSPSYESPLSDDPTDFASFLPPSIKFKLAEVNASAATCSALKTKQQHFVLDDKGSLRLSTANGSVAKKYGTEWNPSWVGHFARRWDKEERLAPIRTQLANVTHAPCANLNELPVVITEKRKNQFTRIDKLLEEHVQTAVLKPSRFFKFPPHIELHNTAVAVFEHHLRDWAEEQRTNCETLKGVIDQTGCVVEKTPDELEETGHAPMLTKLKELDTTDVLAEEIVRATLSRINGLISGPHYHRFLEKAKQAFNKQMKNNVEDKESTIRAFGNYIDQLQKNAEKKAHITPSQDYHMIMAFLKSDETKALKLRKLIGYMSDLMEVGHNIGIRFVDELKELQEENPETNLTELVSGYTKPEKNYYLQAYECCKELLNEHYEEWQNDRAFSRLEKCFVNWVEKHRSYCDYTTHNFGNVAQETITRKVGDKEIRMSSFVLDQNFLKLFSYVDLPELLQDTDNGENTDDQGWGNQEDSQATVVAAPWLKALRGITIGDDEPDQTIVNVTDGTKVEKETDFPDELVFSSDEESEEKPPILEMTSGAAVTSDTSVDGDDEASDEEWD